MHVVIELDPGVLSLLIQLTMVYLNARLRLAAKNRTSAPKN